MSTTNWTDAKKGTPGRQRRTTPRLRTRRMRDPVTFTDTHQFLSAH